MKYIFILLLLCSCKEYIIKPEQHVVEIPATTDTVILYTHPITYVGNYSTSIETVLVGETKKVDLTVFPKQNKAIIHFKKDTVKIIEMDTVRIIEKEIVQQETFFQKIKSKIFYIFVGIICAGLIYLWKKYL